MKNADFKEYLKKEKAAFISAVNAIEWNTFFRTKCENIIIAYDQILDKFELQEEYAKQKSIDFICWYELSGWIFNPSTGTCKNLKFYDVEEKSFEELYNEFDRDVSGL